MDEIEHDYYTVEVAAEKAGLTTADIYQLAESRKIQLGFFPSDATNKPDTMLFIKREFHTWKEDCDRIKQESIREWEKRESESEGADYHEPLLPLQFVPLLTNRLTMLHHKNAGHLFRQGKAEVWLIPTDREQDYFHQIVDRKDSQPTVTPADDLVKLEITAAYISHQELEILRTLAGSEQAQKSESPQHGIDGTPRDSEGNVLLKSRPKNCNDWCQITHTLHDQHPTKTGQEIWAEVVKLDGESLATPKGVFKISINRDIAMIEGGKKSDRGKFLRNWKGYLDETTTK